VMIAAKHAANRLLCLFANIFAVLWTHWFVVVIKAPR